MGMTINIVANNSGMTKAEKDEAVARAMEAIGIHLEGEAKDELENAPRRVDTGKLKNSIGHKSNENTAVVGTRTEYAIYVHFGTRKMAANPFLKNAFERNIGQIKKYILEQLKG